MKMELDAINRIIESNDFLLIFVAYLHSAPIFFTRFSTKMGLDFFDVSWKSELWEQIAKMKNEVYSEEEAKAPWDYILMGSDDDGDDREII